MAMALTKDQFAEQLRFHRALRGLNQTDVAHAAGVELRSYQRWEAGERMPYKKHVLALAKALDVDVQVFTGSLDTSDALLRIEQAITENNRLLRQLYAYLMAAAAARPTDVAAVDPGPQGQLEQALRDLDQGIRDAPPSRGAPRQTRRRAG